LGGAKIIRGAVNANGTVRRGSGFTSSRAFSGNYQVTFNTAFTSTPVVIVSQESDNGAWVANVPTGWTNEGVWCYTTGFKAKFHQYGVGDRDRAFNFIAMES